MASRAIDVEVPAPRTTDARLVRAFELVGEPSVSVLSLDVFDTMLWRRVPEAVDAFPLVGARLAERGLMPPEIHPVAFKKLRIGAEARARLWGKENGRGVEVTLDEIYEMLRFAAVEQLVEVELEVERELLFPDLDILELARWARASGKQVVAVSDTYFSESELRSLLEPHYTLDTQLDRVFASNAYREGKTSGLFEIVLRELGREPREVVHIGDNEHSDIESARRHGIRGVYFERRPRELARILAREHAYLDDEQLRPHGDHGLTAVRSKVLHRRELVELPEELRAFWRFGATALGPALTGFATWVHGATRSAGAEKAFCLMREGELLAKLINGCAAHLDDPVAAEPIWLSRQVCARASIVDGSAAELDGLLARRQPPTVRDLCATLRLDLGASPLLERQAESRLNDATLAKEVFGEISSNPELRGPLVSDSRLLRERLVDYITERVPAGPFVLVDLGWGGTIQAFLHYILKRSNVPVRVVGLYLLTHDLATERMLDGLAMAGYLANCGVPNAMVRSIMRSPEILEQVCMPDVGTQVDLNSDLDPVLAEPIDRALTQSAERGAVQSGILAFQREWTRYADLEPGYPRLAELDVREQLLAQVTRASVAPTAGEAAVLSTWVHDENYGSSGTEPLVGERRVARALRHMDPEALIELPMSDVYWPFGLAALEDEHLAAALDAVTTGRLPVGAFRSKVETGDFDVYYDNGFGFGEGWKVALEARRNRFGLSYARTKVRADEVRGVQIRPARAPCLARIDWLSLRCFMRGRPEPHELLFDTAEAFERVSIRNARPVAPKVWLTGDDPRFDVDLRAALGGGVYEVIVECGYALLPVAPPRGNPHIAELRRRTESGTRAMKRLARQVEGRTGIPVEPLRKGWRRVGGRVRRALKARHG